MHETLTNKVQEKVTKRNEKHSKRHKETLKNMSDKSQVKFDGYAYSLLSEKVWFENYKGPDETVREEVWQRVATSCATVETTEKHAKVVDNFLRILYNDKFVPGGRILANLGIPTRDQTTLYNCFVHSVIDLDLKNADSIEGIYKMLTAQAQTLKSEGGYGINASWIRPEGAYVSGIGSRTPGVLKFMELWDKSSEIITQGSRKILGEKRPDEKNKIRKGAQMLVLDVWHPDIEEFIVAKQTANRLTKFNISVGVTDGFMEAVINDEEWELKFPDTEHHLYDELWRGDLQQWEAQKLPVIIHKKIRAKDLWEQITRATYNRNEPGVLFLDVSNKLNPLSWTEILKTTNPCGEVVMPLGVCNLGSINLPMFVKQTTSGLEFDWEEFKLVVQTAIRFLDNINDISTTPLPEYELAIKEKRRIGLGVMGLGSLHMMLGIRYGSDASLELTRLIFKTKAENELLASAQLGAEKGSFGKFDRERYFSSYWWSNLAIDPDIKTKIETIGEMRNSHQSMNAPTGNTGIYARNVSGGIEPVFSTEYVRWSIVPEQEQRRLSEQGFKFPDVSKSQWNETIHMKFVFKGDEQILKGTFDGYDYEIDKNRGLTIGTLVQDYGFSFAKHFYGEKFEEMKAAGRFGTTNELSVKEHLNVLKVMAHYVNMSISKTLNFPNDYPYEDFKDVYLETWRSNIKGVTTYRAGTMTAVLEDVSAPKQNTTPVLEEHHAPKRPEKLPCDIYHMQVRGERWNFFVSLYGDKPYEIFAGRSEHVSLPRSRKKGTIKKNGTYNLYTGEGDNELVIKDLASVFENTTESAFTRTCSLALRHGVPVQYITEQIEKGADKDNEMFSLAKGLLRVLKHYIKDGTRASIKKCPKCHAGGLSYQEGCVMCPTCGYSRCG